MASADEMLREANDYIGGRTSLQRFADWFEENGDAYDDPAMHGVYVAIEGVFAGYLFDHIGQDAFREELANAIRPFEHTQERRQYFVTVGGGPFAKGGTGLSFLGDGRFAYCPFPSNLGLRSGLIISPVLAER